MYLSKDQTDKTKVTCMRNRADVIYNFKVSFFTMGQLSNFPWNVSSGAACMLYYVLSVGSASQIECNLKKIV